MSDQPSEQANRRGYCRKAIALWLSQLSRLIHDGEVDAFDLRWSHDADLTKPLGRVVFDPQYIQAPLPEQAPKRTPIPVEDLSEQLRDLKPCDDPDCPNCKPEKS